MPAYPRRSLAALTLAFALASTSGTRTSAQPRSADEEVRAALDDAPTAQVASAPSSSSPQPGRRVTPSPRAGSRPASRGGASPSRGPAAQIDRTTPLLIEGAVTAIEWISPTVLFHITDVQRRDWVVQMASPDQLPRAGLERDTIRSGASVRVIAYAQGNLAACKPCAAEALTLKWENVSYAIADARKIGA